jgi:antitoxin component YwqK of YwqJK toxin-antitoxin module
VRNQSYFSFIPFILLLVCSCGSGKLITVLEENENGNTVLQYRKAEAPENLVTEIRFYPNGDTLSVTPTQQGAIHGDLLRYGKNNKLKERITYVKGVQDGLFQRFDKDGVLVFEGMLKRGKKEGVWTTWYDDVQKEEERKYADDEPDGKWTYWYIDGNVRREEVYESGKLIEATDY